MQFHPQHQMAFPDQFDQFYPPPNYEHPFADQMGAYYPEHQIQDDRMNMQENTNFMANQQFDI